MNGQMDKIRLKDEIMESYWVIVRDIWKEITKDSGYIPLMMVFGSKLFEVMWLERVRLN